MRKKKQDTEGKTDGQIEDKNEEREKPVGADRPARQRRHGSAACRMRNHGRERHKDDARFEVQQLVFSYLNGELVLTTGGVSLDVTK